jgi:uncharacterized membrane protein
LQNDAGHYYHPNGVRGMHLLAGTCISLRGSPPAGGEGLSADAFRGLVTAFKDAQMQRAASVETGVVAQRRERIKALIDQHIDDTKWRELLHQARQVAETWRERIPAVPLSKRAMHG